MIAAWLRRIRNMRYIIAGMKHNLRMTINDEFLWDRYVSEWERSKENRHYKYLGNEWSGEEDFINFLSGYALPTANVLETGVEAGASRQRRFVYSAMFMQRMSQGRCCASVMKVYAIQM